MAAVYLQLLGEFCLTYAGKPITTLDTPRLRSLVGYLALHRHAPQERHRLAFLFWPDSTEAQALTNLRKHLLHLRNTLPAVDTLLTVTRQTVQWLPTAADQLDVAAFETLAARAAAATGEQAGRLLREAVAVYGGDLLPACYDEWIFPVREALRTQYGATLTRLVHLLEQQRDYSAAITYAQQWLRHDALHEPTYRTLMRLYALNGDRATALRTYHACVTQLREELGVDPDEETQQSYARLLQGETARPQPAALVANAPFVGRQSEWQQLQTNSRTALAGQPQLVLIAGEAGIGKTRLAEELLHWAHHQGFCTARARCYAAEGQLPYAPVVDWLRAEPVRLHRTKVAAIWRTELVRLLPELLQADSALPTPAPLTQSWQRRQLFEAIARTLLAGQQPLFLLVDDLQWCDQETLEWLHFLLRLTAGPLATELGPVQLLVIGTARLPDEVDATHPLQALLHQLRGGAQLMQIDLARLSQAETSTLAQQMVEGKLPPQMLQQLYADTAGNPFFVVETIRATQERWALHGGINKAAPVLSAGLAEGEEIVRLLPPKVLAMLQARLGQLSTPARELCTWAAIIGQAFTLELLVQASKIPVEQAVAALDELWRRRIIREQGANAYDFSHDRIRDVAAAGISRVRRQYLHGVIAAVLESQNAHQLDSVAAQIAAHYDGAGQVEKAIHYYQQAAEASLHIYANQEAVGFLNRALTLVKQLPVSRVYAEIEYSLLVKLGPPLVALQGYGSQQIRMHYLAAYQLAEQLNYPVAPAILRILAIGYLTHRKFDLAYKFGMELLKSSQLNEQIIDPLLYVESSYTLGVTTFWQGHFQLSRQYLEQGVAAYQQKNHSLHVARYGQDPGVICLARLAWVLWYLGYPEQAFRYSQQAISLATLLHHPFSLDYALLCKHWLAYDARQQSATDEVVEQLSVHQTQFELSAATRTFAIVSAGDNLVRKGKHVEGIGMIRSAIEVALATNYDLMYKSHFQAIFAQAMASIGDWGQAYQAVDTAITHAQTYGDNFYLAELYRLKGEISRLAGQPDPVSEVCFQQAIDIARRQAAKSLELRSAISLARLWEQRGKRQEAYTLLAEVYNWFTEGFDTADLQAAKALLIALCATQETKMADVAGCHGP